METILGSYGNKIIKAPNLGKLAKEGFSYTNACTTVGDCTPSRFSIITGMYPTRLEAHNMKAGNYHNYKYPEQLKHKSNIRVRDKTCRNVLTKHGSTDN